MCFLKKLFGKGKKEEEVKQEECWYNQYPQMEENPAPEEYMEGAAFSNLAYHGASKQNSKK